MPVSVVELAGVCTGDGPCDTTHTSTSTTDNWVARAGGLPPYILAYAHAFIRKGMPKQRAIAMAVGVLEDIAAGRRKVTPATRARAAAAIAQWNALRAKAHATHDHSREAPMTTINLASGSMVQRLMPDAAAVVRFARKVEKWPEPRRSAMKKVIAARAKALGMKPDLDNDFDYDQLRPGQTVPS